MNPAAGPFPGGVGDNEQLYVEITLSNGTILGGGWIELSAANLSTLQTYTAPTGAGAATPGHAQPQPLTFKFLPGAIEPTLLQMEGAGSLISQIEIAGFKGGAGGPLIDDYRLKTAHIASSDRNVGSNGTTFTTTFNYTDIESLHNDYNSQTAPPSQTITGWNFLTNVADISLSPATAPTIADVNAHLAPIGTGEGLSTTYYLTFTTANGATFAGDGSPLYQISSFDASALTTARTSFSPIAFTLASNQLTTALDQDLAAGTALTEVNLFGYTNLGNGSTVQVLRDAYKLDGLTSDTVDAATGAHTLSVSFGGVVDTSIPLNLNQTQGNPVVGGWNVVANKSDVNPNQSLDASGGVGVPITLPPLNPAQAVSSGLSNDTLYLKLEDAQGAALGGGWIALQDASFKLTNAINVTLPSGGGAKAQFQPLTLTFAAGTLEPTLLQMEASGAGFSQIDVAAFAPDSKGVSTLVDDYRFNFAELTGSDHSVVNGVPTITYNLVYSGEQSAYFTENANGALKPSIQGWNEQTSASNLTFDTSALPTTQSAVQNLLAATSTGEGLNGPACFCAGARLLTERGEVAVEALRVGDRLITVSGEARPVIWMGRRRYDCAGDPHPELIWPVVVERGALGDDAPARDLWLSPEHCLYVENRLVQVKRLVNGASVRQVACDRVDYWHVELERHDAIFAEGLAAETFLDAGNRANFESADVVTLHPRFAPKSLADACAAFLEAGAPLTALRARLAERAATLGYQWEGEPDLHVRADGVRIEPIALPQRRWAFVLPPTTRSAALISRVWRPAWADPASGDDRQLGVCVSALQVDGRDLRLDDAGLAEGWNGFERDHGHRWTTGAAQLPVGARLIVVELRAAGRYLRRAEPRAARRA